MPLQKLGGEMNKIEITLKKDNPLFKILNTKRIKDDEPTELLIFEFQDSKWNDIFKKIKEYRDTDYRLPKIFWDLDKKINGSITDKQTNEINCNMIAKMCQDKGLEYPLILKETK